MSDFEVHPVGAAAKLAALQYDTPEAINITDKAARELLEVEKLKAIIHALESALKLCIRDRKSKLDATTRFVAYAALEKAEAL